VPDVAGWRRSLLGPILSAAALAAAISALNDFAIPVSSLDRRSAAALGGAEVLLFAMLYVGVLLRGGVRERLSSINRVRRPRHASASDAEAA
jgi:hypothetical protein